MLLRANRVILYVLFSDRNEITQDGTELERLEQLAWLQPNSCLICSGVYAVTAG